MLLRRRAKLQPRLAMTWPMQSNAGDDPHERSRDSRMPRLVESPAIVIRSQPAQLASQRPSWLRWAARCLEERGHDVSGAL